MSPNLMLACKAVLSLLGTGTMAVGAAAPTDSVWIKIVAVLCGVITLLMGFTFTTLIAHLVKHNEIVDDNIEKQAEICALKRENIEEKLDKIYRKICGEKEE